MPGLVDLADWRFYRDAQRLHQLGPRATFELLCGIGYSHLCRTEIELAVRRFAQIDQALLNHFAREEPICTRTPSKLPPKPS